MRPACLLLCVLIWPLSTSSVLKCSYHLRLLMVIAVLSGRSCFFKTPAGPSVHLQVGLLVSALVHQFSFQSIYLPVCLYVLPVLFACLPAFLPSCLVLPACLLSSSDSIAALSWHLSWIQVAHSQGSSHPPSPRRHACVICVCLLAHATAVYPFTCLSFTASLSTPNFLPVCNLPSSLSI